jgi:dipeptidase E
VDKPHKAPELAGFAGLNIVDFYPVPHRGNFPFAKAMEKVISQHPELNLIPYSNHQVILVEGDNVKVVDR